MWSLEALKPTMKELRRHVIVDQYAVFWRDIAFELDLDCNVIDDIEEKYPDCKDCFYHVLKIWLKSNVTWKALEIAIINAKNVKDELDLIDDLDGKMC